LTPFSAPFPPKLRRPFLSDRYFLIVVRLLKRRENFTEPDFALWARAFNRARALHPFSHRSPLSPLQTIALSFNGI
jgi:hypothetical protein